MAVWASTFISSKILLLEGLQPLEIFFCRFLLAYLCLPLLSRGRKWRSLSWRDEGIFCVMGLMGGTLYFLAENVALIYDTAANVNILVSSTPMLTALLVGLCYKEERLNLRQTAGSLIAFTGMALVVLNGQLVLHLNPLGDILALTAALTWAVYSLLVRMMSARYSVTFITRKVFFWGLVTALPLLALGPRGLTAELLARPVVWGNLLFLGLVASALCYVSWNVIMKRLGTVKASYYIMLQPLITTLMGALVLGEPVSAMAVAGMVVLIAGLTMVQKRPRKSVRAVLFDLDGTLIDTEGQYTEIWGRIGRKYHPEMPDFAYRIKGTTLDQILAKYFPDEKVQREVVPELYAHEAQMKFEFYPGALDFLRNLKAHGVKCAVVTSSNRKKMETLRRQIGDFDRLFDCVFTAEDFKASKPDPDCYLRAAAAFALEKDRCVVFEDAPNGLEAGRRSGIFTVGVATGLTKEQITPLCDAVVEDYRGFTTEALERIVEQKKERKNGQK